MSIDRLQTHYGFSKMPFGRDIPPQGLHLHPAHREAVARTQWCVSQRQMGVITGEVGAGKTVAVRAALASLEASRHQVIYIGDPTIGLRGIHTQIVTALGGSPAFYSGVLASQTAHLLATELDERSRLPVVVIDEAHMLSNTDLEALLDRARDLLGGLEVSSRRTELVVLTDNADLAELDLSGFARTALDELVADAATDSEDAVTARDALMLLHRLVGRTK